MKECRMCFNDSEELHHFDFYVTGSEGIWICPDCRLEVTEYIRSKRNKNLNAKIGKMRKSRNLITDGEE